MTSAMALKEEGNTAYKEGDYERALQLYTDAIALDPSSHVYVSNRAMTNLKLERWADAQEDATEALRIKPEDTKALYRRAMARKELCDYSGSLEDLKAVSAAGDVVSAMDGGTALVDTILTTAVHAKERMVKAAHPNGFTIKGQPSISLGAFADRPFVRGDLILTEKPLYTAPFGCMQAHGGQQELQGQIDALSDKDKLRLRSLYNAFALKPQAYRSVDVAYHATNAFASRDDCASVFIVCSRFNNSCRPNARYSWHEPSGKLRIFAIAPIAKGEEINIFYIQSRNMYGSPCAARQKRFTTNYGFTCMCVVCTLPEKERKESDARREKLARIWEAGNFVTPNRTAERLRSIVHAVHLLREEAYHADVDDFTNDAAALCACHADEASCRYWTDITLEARRSEFGQDSPRVKEIQTLEEHKRSMVWGSQRRQSFATIRV